MPRNVQFSECSAYPYSLRWPACAAWNAPPRSAANPLNTPISVLATGSSQRAPGEIFRTASSSGPSSGWASSAGEPSAAACSASRTTSCTWSSRTPARDTTPTEVPAVRRLIAITVSWRDRETPLVVSVLPAQRRFAAEVSSAITMQSSDRAAASARSIMSWGPVLTEPLTRVVPVLPEVDWCGLMPPPPRC